MWAHRSIRAPRFVPITDPSLRAHAPLPQPLRSHDLTEHQINSTRIKYNLGNYRFVVIELSAVFAFLSAEVSSFKISERQHSGQRSQLRPRTCPPSSLRSRLSRLQLNQHQDRDHRGRHAKIFGWAKSAAYGRRSASDLWPITHNIGIEDKYKSCVMCVKFSKKWKTILHTILLKFL